MKPADRGPDPSLRVSSESASLLHALLAWLALCWVMLLVFGHVLPAGGASAGTVAAPELSASLLAGLVLLNVGLLLVPRHPRASGLVGLACLTVVASEGLRWSMGLSGGDLLSNRVVAGAAALGRVALGGWLTCAALAVWAMAWGIASGLALALFCIALMTMAVTAAGVFAVTCWVIVGEPPGASVLLSTPVLVATALLSAATLVAGWARVVERSRLYPEEGYRWVFARSLALLMTTSVLAGLGAAALMSVHSAELLAEGLQGRAWRMARALDDQVARSVALAQSLRMEIADDDRWLQALAAETGLGQAIGGSARLLRPGQVSAIAVIRQAGLSAGLRPDGTVQLEMAATAADAVPRVVQMRPPPRPTLDVVSDRAPPTQGVQPIICDADTGSTLQCAPLGLTDVGEASASMRPYRLTPKRLRGVGALYEVHGGDEGPAMAVLAPVGTLGSQLLLKIDSAQLFRAVGGPMLQAMLLLSGLALLGAAWSYWRQLPRLRAGHLAHVRVEATMRHLPLATLVLDAKGAVVQANPAADRLFGATGGRLAGLDVERLLPGLRSRSAPPQGESAPFDALALDGSERPVEAHRSSYMGLGQRYDVLTLRDLRAERRQSEDLLRWRHMVEHAGSGMAIGTVGDAPRLEWVNLAYARMLGYEPAALIGQPIARCIAPDLWPNLLRLRTEAAAGPSVQAQLRHQRHDGTEIPTLVNLSAIRDSRGRATHYFVSVQDISALKHAEDNATRHAIHLRAVLDALPVGVWIGDSQGLLQQTNQAAGPLWAGTDELLARGEHESLMRRAAITRHAVVGEPVELAMPEREPRSLLTTASPMLDADGLVIGAIAIDEDLSSLRRGERALRQAHDRLERVLQTCAVGLALLDAEGTVLKRNPAWTLLLGSQFDADVLENTLASEDSLLQQDLIAHIVNGERPSYAGEHRMRRANGDMAWTLLVASPLSGEPGDPARVLMQVLDVNDRRETADEIAASHLRLAAAQRLARVGDWSWDVDRDRIAGSEQMLSMLGLPSQTTLDRARMVALVRPSEREHLEVVLDRAVAQAGRIGLDLHLRRSDGSELIAHLQGVAQRLATGPYMSGTLQDISERKRIESELRDSQHRLRELMAYEDQLIEDERKRIAREVHDELGQLLTALRMDLSMLRSQLTDDSDAARLALRMRDTMVGMTDVVRHVASHLRPAALDLGLVAAIEWLAEDFSLRWETQCVLELPREDEPELAEAVSLALFRAVQESLTNIARHARAKRVVIGLLHEAGEVLRLRIADDGQGFDPTEVDARRTGGLGLLGMRERMHMIGAALQIRSDASGTVVEITYRIHGAKGDNRLP